MTTISKGMKVAGPCYFCRRIGYIFIEAEQIIFQEALKKKIYCKKCLDALTMLLNRIEE